MTKNPAISPTQEQSAAITSIVQWYGDKHQQEYYLAGYAGVGKSTLVEIAIEEIKSKYKVKRICTACVLLWQLENYPHLKKIIIDCK